MGGGDRPRGLRPRGLPAFSPIAHTGHVALSTGIDPWDHATCMPADAPFMAAASSLVVVMLADWDTSAGVAAEVEAFRQSGKPASYLDPLASEWLARQKATVRVLVDFMAGASCVLPTAAVLLAP